MVSRQIALLNQETIDQIAAGEVVERPSSVVKELTENAIDAGSTAVTVEIKQGGIDYIRITDNGCGIERDQIPLAFLRHSTSKIRNAEDLAHVRSLGFRGEALSSISAVARVELITKPKDQLTGTRYVIEGGQEKANEEIGAPDGTTILIRDLFYNTPARRKFLKSATTEGNYINDIMERLALSHPEIAFRLIVNGKQKVATAGNGNLKDAIYQIYGRDIAKEILPIHYEKDNFAFDGFIGKPMLTRGNRNYENFFVDQRFVKSKILSKGIEEGYKGFMMQHQYPFCVIYVDFKGDTVDVNVHPTKMEVRFENGKDIYDSLLDAIRTRLLQREDIANVPVHSPKPEPKAAPAAKSAGAEPFERHRLEAIRKEVTQAIHKDTPYERKFDRPIERPVPNIESAFKNNTLAGNTAFHKSESSVEPANTELNKSVKPDDTEVNKPVESGESKSLKITTPESVETASTKSAHVEIENLPIPSPGVEEASPVTPGPSEKAWAQEVDQANYVQPSFLSEEAVKQHKIIGQLFDTYWMVEYDGALYIIDQHAAHEKVLYEKTMATLKDKDMTSQMVSPPIIVTLDSRESAALEKYFDSFRRLGFVVEPFGGKEYSITGVPANLFNVNMHDLFMDMIASCSDLKGDDSSELILERVASMSCKAAVKGNMHLSRPEIETLIDDLLSLENPYHCPHGRPTIIKMTKYEIEKKFKRIV